MREHLSQCERILNWLLTGDTIDFYKCLEQIGSNNLKGRIWNIEDYAKKGKKPYDIIFKYPHSDPKHPIQRRDITLPNGKEVRIYWLNKIEVPKTKQLAMMI
jgi:hypothetical protein